MTLKRKGLKRTGPLPGPFQPSRLKYKCPVFECKSAKIRGDRIAEHFQSFANLIVLDKCNENVQLLRKNNLPAGNIIENSDELLKSLMASATASEKFHTKYLYENGFSSMNLPYNIHMYIYILGVSPSLVSRWREGYSFWSSSGP